MRHKLACLAGLSVGQPAAYLWPLVSSLNWFFLFHDYTIKGAPWAPELSPVLSMLHNGAGEDSMGQDTSRGSDDGEEVASRTNLVSCHVFSGSTCRCTHNPPTSSVAKPAMELVLPAPSRHCRPTGTAACSGQRDPSITCPALHTDESEHLQPTVLMNFFCLLGIIFL